MSDTDKRVVVGHLAGLHGVRGWFKVYSYTQPLEQIFDYQPWLVSRGSAWHEVRVAQAGGSGKRLIAQFDGVDDRDAAAPWVGSEIAVARSQLPPSEHGSWLWADLEGCRVVTKAGVELGTVDHLLETGANDVLVVKGDRERLIPLLTDTVVLAVDLEAGEIRVDWDPDF
ncbi:MAG: ribosome maturation factor RimM [Pseudomonadota bacterium]